jgi:isocitrate/isopropylmalate dehydrogenase
MHDDNSRRNKVIGQLKLNMMSIYNSTAEATALGYARIVAEEKETMLLLSLSLENAAENTVEGTWNNMINAIQADQENITTRAQYVTACKMSFVDETQTLQIDSISSIVRGKIQPKRL